MNGSEPVGNATFEEVAQLMPFSEEGLLARLGASALGESLGFGPADFGRYVRIGRRWLESHAGTLRDLLCLSPTVLAARQMTAGDDAVLAAAIADVLLGIFDLPTAATAALLLTRRGIDTLCANG